MQHIPALKPRFVIFLFLMLMCINGIGVGSVLAADEPPILQIPNTEADYIPGGAAAKVGAGLLINPVGTPNLDGSRILIGENFSAGDELIINGATNGTTDGGLTYTYNSVTGVMTLNGAATTAVYQQTLRLVRYRNTLQNPNMDDRVVTFALGTQLPNSENGHFYEFVTSAAITWQAARDGANARTFFGLQGYLTTITSASENAFVASKLAGQGWMGASDDAADTGGVEGEWEWVAGPEAGSLFCVDGGECPTDGWYTNWAAGEPNNCCGVENHGHFFADGQWNDYVFNNPAIAGYVVEYGGMDGDPDLTIIDNVTVNFPPQEAPILAAIDDKAVVLGNPVAFTAAATDSNAHETVSFSLGLDAPVGAAIDAETGAFTWTPDAYGVYPVTVIATDSSTAGLTDQETIGVYVGDELVVNGDFQDKQGNLPANWDRVKIVKDQVELKCNTNNGNCFLQLKASPSLPRTKIAQIADTALTEPAEAGDFLIVTADIRASVNPGQIIKVKAVYDNPDLGTNGQTLFFPPVPKTSSNFLQIISEPITLEGTLDFVRVRIRYPKKAGKYDIDNISIILTPLNTPIPVGAVAVPAAGGLRK